MQLMFGKFVPDWFRRSVYRDGLPGVQLALVCATNTTANLGLTQLLFPVFSAQSLVAVPAE